MGLMRRHNTVSIVHRGPTCSTSLVPTERGLLAEAARAIILVLFSLGPSAAASSGNATIKPPAGGPILTLLAAAGLWPTLRWLSCAIASAHRPSGPRQRVRDRGVLELVDSGQGCSSSLCDLCALYTSGYLGTLLRAC
ncbi:hypothetical protein RSAG8_01428, partial [Rhizoctonia solani AG-8 WAC10335]